MKGSLAASLPSETPAQKARTRFVVSGMAFMYLISWTMALGRLFETKFWDKKYNLDHVYNKEALEEGIPAMYNSTFLVELGRTYYTQRRFVFFLPHVIGAVFWWNLYFVQLIPQIRHRYKKFHRLLGRCLMVVAILQTTTGLGLAMTTHSAPFKIVSFTLAIAVFLCIYYSWRYAIYRDIPMHKYWVLRLVGYLHTIVLQRFWFLALIVSHQMGFHFLYPPFDENSSRDVANKLTSSMFDDSFVLAMLTAILITEWYLAGNVTDMMKPPVPSERYGRDAIIEGRKQEPLKTLPGEQRPLL